jgi:hypothetical protein
MNNVVVFHCDDWVAVYLNGNKFSEGHSLSNDEWLVIGQKAGDKGNIERIWLDDEQVENELSCDFPQKLSEIPSTIYRK